MGKTYVQTSGKDKINVKTDDIKMSISSSIYHARVNSLAFLMSYSIYPKRGGIHEQVYLLSRELRKRGIKVSIVSYLHEILTRSYKLRLPLSLSGIHPRLWANIDQYERLVMETAWPALASIPLKYIKHRGYVLHLHSLESLPDFGYNAFQRLTVKVLENIAFKYSSEIIVVSLKEYSILRSVLGDKVHYVPLIIDFEELEKYMRLGKQGVRELLGLPKDAFLVAFVGGMSYPPNREAARIIANYIAPKISEKYRGEKILFLIVGPSPPPEITNARNVIVTGYVKTPSPYILASDVCIAPIYHGGGVKTKVLDYLALKKLVIATKKAVEGTYLRPMVHYIPAESPEEFVNVIYQLLKEGIEPFKFVAEKGHEYVMIYHNPLVVIEKFLEVVDNA